MSAATLPKPSIAEFKMYVRMNLRGLVQDMIAAQTFARKERKRVNAYIAPIFAEYDFRPCKDWRGTEPNERLTIDKLYLADLDAPPYLEFSARCLAAHARHGWTGDSQSCPALVAEHAATFAEREVLISMGLFFGTPFERLFGEKREQALQLAIDGVNSR